MRHGLLGIIAGLALLVAACGGGHSQDDAGVQEDVGPPQFDLGQSDLPGQDDGPAGDNNDSFDQAVQMDFTNASQKTGVINPAGDEDFFKFTGTAGQWIAIWVSANATCTTTMLDPVATLYDSTQTQIAQNDDQLSGNCDPFLITRLPADGTYYVKVRDWYQVNHPTDESTWRGDPLFVYKIYLYALSNGSGGTTIDQEPGNDLGTAATLTIPTSSAGSLLGTFAGASDVDVYTFTLPSAESVFVQFAPDGADGNGSSVGPGQVYITDSTGATVMARIDGAQGSLEIAPPLLPAATYALWITAPAGSLGANPFYSATVYTQASDNPLEAEAETATGANDTLALAQALVESTHVGRYYVLAHLPDGDVDYFSIPVTAGDQFKVNCGSTVIGSGVQGLTVSVRDASDTELHTCTENFTDQGCKLGVASGSTITVPTTGTYYMRLSKTGQVADVASNYVRCVFVSVAPST